MPATLPNTTVANAYPQFGTPNAAQVQGDDVFDTGWFTVANNPVFAEYEYGKFGFQRVSPEMYLAPGIYPLKGTDANPLNGIRFRNGIANSNAQVWGSFFYKTDPTILASSEFTSQIAPSAGSGTTSSIILAGCVNGAGAIVRGTGFTVAHPSTGNYTITFNSALSFIPIVLFSCLDTTQTNVGNINTISNTGFQLDWLNLGAALANTGFNFIVLQAI